MVKLLNSNKKNKKIKNKKLKVKGKKHRENTEMWHSEDHASWYILIIKSNEMHNFSHFNNKVSNTDIIQRYQSKMLRSITNAPWYVTNQSLHQDLCIPLVRTIYRERTTAHHATLRAHTNPLMETVLKPPSNRRLKRKWTFDETN